MALSRPLIRALSSSRLESVVQIVRFITVHDSCILGSSSVSPHSIHSRRPNDDLGLLIVRLVIGAVFVAHGAQKLFVFGLPDVTNGFVQQGIPFANVTAPLVSMLEFFGGIAIVVGLLTRFVALGLVIDMLAALYLVHLPSGFFLPNGFEFVLTLASINLALVLTGAGAYSIDAIVARRRHAPRTTRSGPVVTSHPRPV